VSVNGLIGIIRKIAIGNNIPKNEKGKGQFVVRNDASIYRKPNIIGVQLTTNWPLTPRNQLSLE
jgi:hypothetical protein